MKVTQKLLLIIGLACACSVSTYAQTIVMPGTFKHVTIDGSFTDWTGVPLAYSQAQPPGDVVAFKNLYVANDKNYLYIRFSLYNSTNPFTSKQNIFIDADDNSATGYSEHGVGSEMLIQSQTGYQETNGVFNDGAISGLSWLASPTGSGTDFEVRISRSATYTGSGKPVFANNTIAIFLESSESGGNEWFPNVTGGLTYTFASELGIMVPAYFNPSSHAAYWTELDSAASRVPLITIMNPGSGPGPSKSTSYTNALYNLHQAGGLVIGYVYTSDGSRSLSDVETDINTYLSWYDVDGFFLDEMAHDANTTHYNYYQSIYQYIKGKGNYSVTGNPGENTQQSYISIPTVDAVVDFEGYGTNYPGWSPSSWTANYPPEQFVNIPHYVTSVTLMTNYVNLAASRNAGWVYVGDNSYSDLPSYWTNEVNFVQSLNAP